MECSQADATAKIKLFEAVSSWLKDPERTALWATVWHACVDEDRDLRPLVLGWARCWQAEYESFFPNEEGRCPALLGQIVDSAGTPRVLSRQPHPIGVGRFELDVDQVN